MRVTQITFIDHTPLACRRDLPVATDLSYKKKKEKERKKETLRTNHFEIRVSPRKNFRFHGLFAALSDRTHVDLTERTLLRSTLRLGEGRGGRAASIAMEASRSHAWEEGRKG